MTAGDLYLSAVLLILIGGYAADLFIGKLDVSCASPVLPAEFEGYYDAEKYRKSQSYHRTKILFGLAKSAVYTLGAVVFILAGWFDLIDRFARSLQQGTVVTGLIFTGILCLIYLIFSIPFDAYRTFVIEEEYGFNRTTPRIFVTDIFKNLLVGMILGAAVLSVIFWFFNVSGSWAWSYAWAAVTALQFIIMFIAPVAIMPLFNKFTPLKEGELKTAINDYARAQDFRIRGIYTMDASRRSAQSNAFFTGFGRYKRVVLYDTLVAQMKTDELVAVLAHEIGHYKHRDIFKSIAVMTAGSGLMFFALSFFINNKDFFGAFKMGNTSVYAGLFLFTFLYQPVHELLSVGVHYMSRRFEILADRFSVVTYKKPEAMISALKRLSVENLSNLTPHPLKVALCYSHPPVLTRIEAIRLAAG